MTDQNGLRGQLQVQGSADEFHGSVVSTMTGTAPTVTWTGTGEWRDLPGYTFTATAVDGSPDTFSVVITSPTGTVVFTTNGAKPLQGGNITVH